MKSLERTRTVEFVVCGRFQGDDPRRLEPGPRTRELFEALTDGIRRKELICFGRVSFCACGQAEVTGPSVSILPEQVRYTDVNPEDVSLILERHLESVVRGST